MARAVLCCLKLAAHSTRDKDVALNNDRDHQSHRTAERLGSPALPILGAALVSASCVVGDPAVIATTGDRDLDPVADFRELGYVPRARPTGIELSADEQVVFVSLAGDLIEPDRRVLALEAGSGSLRAEITVGLSPQGMALDTERGLLFVANQFSNYLSVVDAESYVEHSRIRVSFYAQDIAIADDGNHLFVSNRWLDAVEVVRLDSPEGTTGHVVRAIPVGTNPRDVVVGDDSLVYIGSVGATSISVVDPGQGLEIRRIQTNAPVNGLAAGPGHIVAASLGEGDGHRKFGGLSAETPGATYRGDGTANTGFGDINNDLIVVSTRSADASYVRRYTSDTAEVSRVDAIGDLAPETMIVAGALPEQLVIVGSQVYVSMSASDTVQVLTIDDGGALRPEAVLDTGINPFELAVTGDGQTVFTADRLGETVSRIDVATNTRLQFEVGSSGPSYPATDYERGEMLFHSARLSSEALPSSVFPQGDRAGDKSCNHCHRETLTDGKVWSVGTGTVVPLGGQRLAPAARNIRDTLPLFWEGVQTEHDFDLEVNEFAPPVDFDCDATETEEHPESCVARDEFFVRQVGFDFETVSTELIGEFLMGRPRLLPNPMAQAPSRTEAAAIQRGRALFFSPVVGCGSCHPSADSDPTNPFTVNENLGPVISPSPLDNGVQFKHEVDGNFNVPSLRGLWDRPTLYFHDGRAKSLMSAIMPTGHPALSRGTDGCQRLAEDMPEDRSAVFRPITNGRGCNDLPGGGHGQTQQLSSEQVSDLLSFLLSIE